VMKCAVAPRNDARVGFDHASTVSDMRPKDFYGYRVVSERMLEN
jgi:hypothetical protein